MENANDGHEALRFEKMDRLRSSRCKSLLVVIQTGRRRRWTLLLTRSYPEQTCKIRLRASEERFVASARLTGAHGYTTYVQAEGHGRVC
jgi:hypothetical protein